jgi:hypothetical protein
MTALLKYAQDVIATPAESLHDGIGVEMFSSGAAPCMTDMLSGDATALFSSGAAPVMAGMDCGGETGLYSSGAAPVTGELVGLFSSGAAPAARARLSDGTGTHLFSSGA